MTGSKLKFLEEHGCGDLHHSDGSLLHHLLGTAVILEDQGMPDHVVDAGLFHAVYGTGTFDDAILSTEQRGLLQDLIGLEAERLVYLYAMRDARCFADLVCELTALDIVHPTDLSYTLIDRRNGEPYACSASDIAWLCALVVANEMEQRARIPELASDEMGPHRAVLHKTFGPNRLDVRKPRSITEQACSILEWKDRTMLVDAIRRDHLVQLEGMFHRWSEDLTRNEPANVEAIIELLRSLPQAAYERFLIAPSTYSKLFNDRETQATGKVDFVLQALQAELCRSTSRRAEQPLWTALGDLYIPPSSDRQPSRAPHLFDSIAVDFDSPHSGISMPGGPERLDPIPHAHRTQVVKNLVDAMCGIEHVAPHAADLILTTTKAIACKRDLIDRHSFGSSSWSWQIGKVGLSNPDLDSVTVEMLANALVHESIHSILYMIEVHKPFICLKEAERTQITSPWSQRSLYLPSFLHACFVWFGLFSFWERARGVGVFNEHESQILHTRSGAGFLDGPLVARLDGVKESLDPDVLRAIAFMQETVLGQMSMVWGGKGPNHALSGYVSS